MIKSENGVVTLDGRREVVAADAIAVLKSIQERLGEDTYKEVLRIAELSDKQVHEECMKLTTEVLDLIEKLTKGVKEV